MAKGQDKIISVQGHTLGSYFLVSAACQINAYLANLKALARSICHMGIMKDMLSKQLFV